MTSEKHSLILNQVRDAIREVSEPISMSDGISDWDHKNVELMREVSASCAPAQREQQLKRLCETVEATLDGTISGWLHEACNQQIHGLVVSLKEIQRTSKAYSDHVEKHSGFSGTLRSMFDLVSSPLQIPKVWSGTSDYQLKRDEICKKSLSAISLFGETLTAFLLSLESAISRRTGENFSFKNGK